MSKKQKRFGVIAIITGVVAIIMYGLYKYYITDTINVEVDDMDCDDFDYGSAGFNLEEDDNDWFDEEPI